MADNSLIVFAGGKSQTGVAFKAEFPGVEFEESNNPNNNSFDTIKEKISSGQIKAPLPIWNSHEGEIKKSFVFDMLFDNEGVLLFWLWPKKIEFICLCNSNNSNLSEKKTIVSVLVAERQCSLFIENNNYVFCKKDSTSIAFEEFKGGNYNAVLCAPEMNDSRYCIISEDAANPVNVTTFALLASHDSENWGETQWGSLAPKVLEKPKVYYAGVVIGADEILSGEQLTFYDNLFDVENIDDFPKILFVAEYQENKYRLLIERNEKDGFDRFLVESGEEENIKVYKNLGKSPQSYSERINSFSEINSLLQGKDFVRHKGDNTCFFACPALGIFIHGYEEKRTEIVFRKTIDMYFKFMDNKDVEGLSKEKQILYNDYIEEYRENGKNFFIFEDIGL